MTTPLHTKAVEYQRLGLFAGIGHFAELERRIEALSDERQRGDAFEVFTEAYLATQRPHDAHTLWPQSAAPVAVLQSLGLTVRDNGVDGVLQSPVGLLSVYQAKFRSGRAALTWRELSTFIGLADSSQIHSRILFTNSDEIPSLMNERRGFFCIRGADLERLEELDFVAIERWLAGAPVEVPKKEPLPHQQEAIAAILPALEQHGRATAVMACGTGKTLVALWVAERSQATKILVLLPSLALVRQTLHEWLHETRWPKLAYLCVCSDPTVTSDIDSLSVQQTDLDFEVNTDSKTVRAFLDADFQGPRLVFCTYQSAHIVAAAMGDDEAFDLGIFDEAHKTAGRVGVRFAFAVADQNLRIRKRLFLTATPRHYDYRKKDKEGDAKLVYSMDVPEVYGPVAVKLTFAEAARRQIICPYKVAISVVTSATVNNERLRRGEVIIDGDRVRAIQVANQIALQKAVAQFGVSKIFTFHRSIKSAESFTSDASEGIATHLPDFARLHVNGNMSTAVRDGLMRSFAEAPKAVMSNARCLTEGVDVPVVDMVAFLTPKRSLIEIVQATGRAMRRSLNKEFGYVLVPLFLEQHEGESIEDALSRTTFREVWNVLGAMLEQDELFVQVIRQMRQERGERGGFDDSKFHELVEVFGEDVPLEAIRRHITVTSIERFGVSWDERYGELKAFKDTYGHCNVPITWEQSPKLAVWIQNTRQLSKQGWLSEERTNALNALGFVWKVRNRPKHRLDWSEMLESLVALQKTKATSRVNQKTFPQLFDWMSRIRRERVTGKLSDGQITALDNIGFDWTTPEDRWNSMFAALVEYQRAHGDRNVPDNWSENPKLAGWVKTQQQKLRDEKINPERRRQLEAIGFVRQQEKMDPWEEMFAALVEFKRQHGHCKVPRRYPDVLGLGGWVNAQRFAKQNGRLEASKADRLETIGFVWNAIADTWEKMFEELKLYKKTNGDCTVSASQPKYRKLASWVSQQRLIWQELQEGQRQARPHTLSRMKRLEELGFDFGKANSQQFRWEEGFTALHQFNAQHGHCNVPSQSEENRKLAIWVSGQRTRMKAGTVTEQQLDRLTKLGFIWDLHQFKWQRMYEALVAYKLQHGHCDIPMNRPTNPDLAAWVISQRAAQKRGKLSANRFRLLDELSFIWQKKQGHPSLESNGDE